MRKIVLIIMALIAIQLPAQIAVGMRDNRFVNVNYTLRNNLWGEFEQSIFSDKPKRQYFRTYIGYKGSVTALAYNVSAFYGMAYNNDYNNYGLLAKVDWNVYKRLSVYGTLNPYKDSGFDFKLCFTAGVKVAVLPNVSILTDYNTVPVYRESEEQYRVGVMFSGDNFWFLPRVAFPLEGRNKLKSLRVETSFNWFF